MTVLEARMPGKPDGYFAKGRTLRGLDRLEAAGCRRLLIPCPLRPAFPVISNRSLWQAMAAPLALAALRSQGKDPRRCVVGIQADRPSRAVIRTCVMLSHEVRALALSHTAEQLLGWKLEQTFGVPLASGGEDVTLSFLPGVSTPERFALGEEQVVIPGFTLTVPGLEPPEGCPMVPLLSALLEQGRLPLSRVAVIADFP
jgi:hypothetical protein